jgi:hypothetical protein
MRGLKCMTNFIIVKPFRSAKFHSVTLEIGVAWLKYLVEQEELDPLILDFLFYLGKSKEIKFYCNILQFTILNFKYLS